MANSKVPDWLKTNKPQRVPTLAEQNLRAENIRLKEEIDRLKGSLKIASDWADAYRRRVKVLETALKEGVGADE